MKKTKQARNVWSMVILFISFYGSAQCVQKALLSHEILSRPACFVIGNNAYFTCSSLQGKKSRSTYVYDQSVDGWTKDTDYPGPPRESAGAFTLFNKGYVVGGLSDTSGIYYTDLKEYDPVSHSWTARASFPGKGRLGALVFSLGSFGYMGMGMNLNGDTVGNDLWKYDPLSDTWSRLPDVPGPPRYLATAFTLNGKAYIGLGFQAEHPYAPLDDLYEFDPATATWTTRQNKPFSGFYADNFSIANTGFLHNAALGFYKYLPGTDTWQSISNCNISSQSSFAIGHKGYFAFGLSNWNQTNELWEYDTGLLATSPAEQINTYPDFVENPISDHATIHSEKTPLSMQLFDLTGRLVAKSTHSKSLEALDLTPGYYILSVKFDNKEPLLKKLLKE